MKTSRLSIYLPETLNVDMMKYITEQSQGGKLHGMKNMFCIVAIMEKLEKEDKLSPEAKKDCLDLLGASGFTL